MPALHRQALFGASVIVLLFWGSAALAGLQHAMDLIVEVTGVPLIAVVSLMIFTVASAVTTLVLLYTTWRWPSN